MIRSALTNYSIAFLAQLQDSDEPSGRSRRKDAGSASDGTSIDQTPSFSGLPERMRVTSAVRALGITCSFVMRSEDKIELMRTCSVGTSDCNDNAVTDNPYHGAPCGDTDTEVASLSSSRQAALLSVCAHRVPVPLGEEFCLQSRRSASGRLQGHASCLLLGDAQNNAEETRLARMATLSNTCFLIGHTRSTLLGTSTIH